MATKTYQHIQQAISFLSRIEAFKQAVKHYPMASPLDYNLCSKSTIPHFYRILEFYPTLRKYKTQIPPRLHTLYRLSHANNFEQLLEDQIITPDTTLKEAKQISPPATQNSKKKIKPTKVHLQQSDMFQTRFYLLQARYNELEKKYDYLCTINDELTAQLKGE